VTFVQERETLFFSVSPFHKSLKRRKKGKKSVDDDDDTERRPM
jgi:hypothetical protein